MRTALAVAGALLAALWLGQPTRLCAAKGGGCPAKSEGLEIYMQRAQEARAAGSLARAADAYWGAWCASDQFGHLVNICKLHSQARDCAHAQEILIYAERRQGSATREQREQLGQCREDVRRLRCDAAPVKREDPPPPPPPTQSVMITVKTTPPGASIFINGEPRGQSDTSLFLPPGAYPLRLDLLGHRSINQVIAVQKDGERSFAYALVAEPPTIEVAPRGSDRSAEGADVYLDEVFKGRVPLTLEVSEGSHQLELRKAGFRTASESIHVRHADHLRIFSVLDAVQQTGQLLVSAEEGAEVYVDGRPCGLVPVFVKDLRPGEHDLEVRRSGAPPWTHKVKIEAGQEQRTAVPRLVLPQPPVGGPGAPAPPGGGPGAPAPPGGGPGAPAPPGGGTGAPMVISPPPVVRPQPMGRLILLNVRRLTGVRCLVDNQEIPEEKALDPEGLSLPLGRHLVLLRKDGYDDLVKEVTINDRSPQRVYVTPNRTSR